MSRPFACVLQHGLEMGPQRFQLSRRCSRCSETRSSYGDRDRRGRSISVNCGNVRPRRRRIPRGVHLETPNEAPVAVVSFVIKLCLHIGRKSGDGRFRAVADGDADAITFVSDAVRSDDVNDVLERLPEGARDGARSAMEQIPRDMGSLMQMFEGSEGAALSTATKFASRATPIALCRDTDWSAMSSPNPADGSDSE